MSFSNGKDYTILWMNPDPGLKQRCMNKQLANFRLCIRTVINDPPENFHVSLWSNIYHKGNNEGEWHLVKMPFLGVTIQSDEGRKDHLYGVDIFLTCLGHYGYNYRVFYESTKKAEKSQARGAIEVRQPVLTSDMTEWIQDPFQAKITSKLWLGNHAAALEAPLSGYDCLINTCDDAPVFAQQLNRPVILKKFPIGYGANRVIDEKTLKTAVRWLWEASLRCDKVLVFSKYGQARAISVIVAYIYARNTDLTFEEAVQFVEARSSGFYHKGLKAALARLYPRG